MRPGDRAEDQDQHDQDGPGRQGVAQKGDCVVSAGELRRHDSRADHGREKEGGPERFCSKAP